MSTGSLAKSAEAEIKIKAPEKLVKILCRALLPEAECPSSARSKISIEGEKRWLTIHINASDIAALRAALNSYFRWADAVLDVVGRVG